MRYNILRLAKGGVGVSHHDGKVFFVASALPGESGEARITEEKARYGYAQALTRDQSAAQRCEDLCPNTRCGGCGFRHVAPEFALKMKAQAVHDEILKAAKLESIEMSFWELDRELDGSRTRARIHVNGGGLGFYELATYRIVPASRCLVIAPELARAMASLEAHLPLPRGLCYDIQVDIDVHGRAFAYFKATQVEAEAAAKPSDSKSKRGGRQRERKNPGAQPVAVFSYAVAKELTAFAQDALKRGDFAGIRIGETNLGEAYIESRTTVQDIELVNYRRNGDFAQATDAANEIIHRLLLDSLVKCRPQYVLDLFSGTGNLTFRAATCVPETLAVERYCDRAAFRRGVVENQDAFLSNAILDLKIFDLTLGLPEEAKGADFVIVDPPRSGLAEKLIHKLIALKPKTIFYVSCEASALARDIASLKKHYRVESLAYVDMFPQTPQVESIALLKIV